MGALAERNEKAVSAKWTRRNRVANVLIILSGVLLLTGIIFAVQLPERMKERAVSRQEWIAVDALEEGYKCYRVSPRLQFAGTENRGDIIIVSTETGETFAVLISVNTKENRTGIHAFYVDVFVREDSAEARIINGTEMTLYTDCYATLDYIGQGEELGGAILAVFLIFGVVFLFLILLVVGIVIKVLAYRRQVIC